MNELLLLGVIASCGFVFGAIAVVASVAAWIELKAMQKSTHKIEYVPVDTLWDKQERAMNDVLERDIPDMAGVDNVNDMMETIS